jgi:hypothetical protein
MRERFGRTGNEHEAAGNSAVIATAEPPDGQRAGTTLIDERKRATSAEGRPHAATPAALATARERQREAFGGLNWGASFFGWLVAVGVAALLSSILVAAGAAIGITESDVTTAGQDELTLGGGVALLAVLVVAYATGGYVAGRLSRFDGGRQGLGTWAIGLVVMVALALAAVLLGDEYNVLEQLNLPSLPVADGESFAGGGAIVLAASIVATVLAALAGGKLGERYHRRVDRAGFVD